MIQYTPISELFKIGFFTVYSFGVMLAIAALVFLVLVIKNSKKIMNPEKAYSLLLFIIIFSLIGARIVYFFANINEFSSIIEFIMLWKGGLSGVGALLGGIFGVFVFSKHEKINFLRLTDFIIPYVALAFAIGKIGCFLRGCCFGLPTNLPWGILYAKNSLASAVFDVPVHPVQLYQSIFTFAIFFILLKFYSINSKKQGQTFFLFLILFSFLRVILDFIRYYPENNYIGSFTIYQISYFIIFLASIVLFFTKKQGNNRKL